MVIAAPHKQEIPFVEDGISRVPLYALLDTQKLKENIKTELEKEMTAKVKEILKGVVDSQIKENIAAINASLSNIYEESNNQQDEIELLKLKEITKKPGCQSGFRSTFSKAKNHVIQFNPYFSETPSVVLGLTVLDSHRNRNLRIRSKVGKLTKTGFTMSINTWYDTILYEAGVSWMACPKYF